LSYAKVREKWRQWLEELPENNAPDGCYIRSWLDDDGKYPQATGYPHHIFGRGKLEKDTRFWIPLSHDQHMRLHERDRVEMTFKVFDAMVKRYGEVWLLWCSEINTGRIYGEWLEKR